MKKDYLELNAELRGERGGKLAQKFSHTVTGMETEVKRKERRIPKDGMQASGTDPSKESI